ncbi:MAG: hypothetical protein Q4C60_04285 [Eubacteriales bacterium]|nr:hypothetical protein [Eubacteriales bacterium]
MAILQSRRIVSEKGIFLSLLCPTLAALFLTTGYWLPAMEQFARQKFKVSGAPLIQISEQTETISKTIRERMGAGTLLLLLASWGIWCYFQVCRRKKNGIFFSLLFTDTIFTVLIVFRPLWEIFGENLNFIQFPWRIVQVTTPLTIIIFAVAVGALLQENVPGRQRWILLGAAGCVAVSAVLSYHAVWGDLRAPRENLDGRVIAQEIRGTSSGEEWLPMDCSGNHFDQPDVAIDPLGSGAQGEKLEGGSVFSGYVDLSQEYYTVPFVYYYGYRAVLEREDGESLELRTDRSDYDSQLRVWLPENGEGVGRITVRYQATAMQRVSYAVSVAAGLALLWIAVRQRKH